MKAPPRVHYSGPLMWLRGGHLTILTGGTKACDPDRPSPHATTDPELVTCARCKVSIERNNRCARDSSARKAVATLGLELHEVRAAKPTGEIERKDTMRAQCSRTTVENQRCPMVDVLDEARHVIHTAGHSAPVLRALITEVERLRAIEAAARAFCTAHEAGNDVRTPIVRLLVALESPPPDDSEAPAVITLDDLQRAAERIAHMPIPRWAPSPRAYRASKSLLPEEGTHLVLSHRSAEPEEQKPRDAPDDPLRYCSQCGASLRGNLGGCAGNSPAKLLCHECFKAERPG